MTMKKRLTVFLFSLLLTLTLFPTTASAAENYDLYLYLGSESVGTRVTSENAADVLKDGTVSYDPDTHTLTLDHARLAGIYTYGTERKTLTIHVIGDCIIDSPRYNGINLYSSIGSGPVYNHDDLVITGDGKLTINALNGNAAGISTYGNVTIENGNVEINSEKNIAIALQDSRDPNQSNTNLHIIDSTVSATTNGTSTNAFYTQKGGIQIDRSNVTVKAGSSSYPALWALTSIEITEDSDVTASGGTGNVFYTQGEIKIDGSVVSADGKNADSPAMYANSIAISNNSDVQATGKNGNAIYVNVGDLTIDHSIVSAKTIGEYASFAIYTYEGNVTVRNDSELTAESGADTAMYVEGNLTLTDSNLTSRAANYQGMIICGILDTKHSTIQISRTSGLAHPALSVEQLNVEMSEIIADGGIEFYNYLAGHTDNIAFRITPSEGKLMELKVDEANHDGSTAVHFDDSTRSPYDTVKEFDRDAMELLASYQYVRIGEHIHTGGTATCTDPAVCEDCNMSYGTTDPNHHLFLNYVYNDDATCTTNGTETAKCERCEKKDTREKPGSALGHQAERIPAKAATCTKEGNIEYWHCAYCDQYFSDATLTQKITKEETIIKAKGHGEVIRKDEALATCVTEGYSGDMICADCGEILEKGHVLLKLDHDYKDGICTICGGADPAYETTRPSDPETTIDTGIGQGAPWALLFAVSGCGVISGLLYGRRKKR